MSDFNFVTDGTRIDAEISALKPMVGGKDKTKIRNATPIEFRNVLLSMVAK